MRRAHSRANPCDLLRAIRRGGGRGGDAAKSQALGVKRTASQREIKRAWRRLALLLHPDKIGPDATEKQKERFADASSAYEVLSDPDRRRVYDDTGDTGPSSAAASGQDRDYTANGGVEMFVHFPRGGFRFRRFVPENPKAEPIVVNVLLTLEQLLEPTQHLFHVKRRVMCPHCLGTGADGMDNIKQCTTCGGTGRQVHLGHGPGEYRQATRIKCPVCSGTGTVVAKPCKVCHGHHTVETSAELNFTVPAGALDGQAVVLQQQGHQAWLHAHGDGVLVVRRAPHKVFQVSEAACLPGRSQHGKRLSPPLCSPVLSLLLLLLLLLLPATV